MDRIADSLSKHRMYGRADIKRFKNRMDRITDHGAKKIMDVTADL